MSISIKVNLALVQAKLPLRGLADVILKWDDEELTIRRCAVFEKSGQPPWVSMPSLPIEKSGKKTYLPLVELPRELKQRIFDAVLAEYRKATNES